MSVTFGSDPEFFIREKGRKMVRGSEEFVKGEGIYSYPFHEFPTVIRDGVQVELNPTPNPCRESHFSELSRAIRRLNEKLEGSHEISFDTRAFVCPDSFEKLSMESKVSGCNPSKSAYQEKPRKQEMEKSRLRYAAGHIHLGGETTALAIRKVGIEKVVQMLDVIVGNTSVLIDQFPGAKERRRYYGRAGEFRDKWYGLEYRVPSNFWLRDYRLYGLMFGLARQAVRSSKIGQVSVFLDKVNMDDVVQAINTNDPVLARKNFDKIKDLLSGPPSPQRPLSTGRLKVFEEFVDAGGKFPERTIDRNFESMYWRHAGWENWCGDAKEQMGEGKTMEQILKDEEVELKSDKVIF